MGVVGTGSSLAIGAIGGVIYYASSVAVLKFGIDDPLEASAVHGFCGFWGVVAVGIFSTDAFVTDAFGSVNEELGARFGLQFLAAFTIMVWTCGMSFIMFTVIDLTIGLRVDENMEKRGLDKDEHGGNAWNIITRRISASLSTSPPKNDDIEMQKRKELTVPSQKTKQSSRSRSRPRKPYKDDIQKNTDAKEDDDDEFDEPVFTPEMKGKTGTVDPGAI